jgi:hypothetical protein
VRLRPIYIDTVTAAVALGIGAAGVRKLAERGLLTRYGTPQRALYDLRECRIIVARRRRVA